MSDLPNQGLFQQAHARPRSGEELEVFGKTAASKWLNGEERTLNDAVIASVKHAHLAPEQVKRVCEFANTDAFLREFKKESGVSHKIVDFDGGPADHGSVIQSLNSGGGGSVFDSGTGDYESPPTPKTAGTLKENVLLAQSFGYAPEIPFENPLVDVMDFREKVAGAYEHLSSQVSGLEIMCEDTSENLYRQVKQAALNGNSLGDIAQVLAVGAPDEKFLKIAFEQMTPRLLREGVYMNIDDALSSMDKTASRRMVDRTHPLVGAISEFAESLSKLAHTRAACNELNRTQAQATAFLKAAAAGKDGVLLRGAKAVNEAAHWAAPKAGGAADKIVEFAVGHGHGAKAKDLVEKGVKLAPKAALGVGAAYGVRRATNDPTLSKAYHSANAHLNPLSNDWDQESYRQQMGGNYPMGY